MTHNVAQRHFEIVRLFCFDGAVVTLFGIVVVIVFIVTVFVLGNSHFSFGCSTFRNSINRSRLFLLLRLLLSRCLAVATSLGQRFQLSFHRRATRGCVAHERRFGSFNLCLLRCVFCFGIFIVPFFERHINAFLTHFTTFTTRLATIRLFQQCIEFSFGHIIAIVFTLCFSQASTFAARCLTFLFSLFFALTCRQQLFFIRMTPIAIKIIKVGIHQTRMIANFSQLHEQIRELRLLLHDIGVDRGCQCVHVAVFDCFVISSLHWRHAGVQHNFAFLRQIKRHVYFQATQKERTQHIMQLFNQFGFRSQWRCRGGCHCFSNSCRRIFFFCFFFFSSAIGVRIFRSRRRCVILFCFCFFVCRFVIIVGSQFIFKIKPALKIFQIIENFRQNKIEQRPQFS
mmetsp:Transcript_21170/g.36082  ORF Transcript_21170/g.36082 Transcript_21170/m.36082 type:complete len:398 (-) Transcript_21170:891-2084(-)